MKKKNLNYDGNTKNHTKDYHCGDEEGEIGGDDHEYYPDDEKVEEEKST